MFSTFYDKNNKIERNIRVVVMDYVKSWFFIDLIAFFPFDTVFTSNNSGIGRLIKLLKLQRLVRLTKVSKIINAINDVII